MIFNIEKISEDLKRNLENIKNSSKKYNVSSEQLVKLGEETIKEMCLPSSLEELMLSKNREWFSGKGEESIDSIDQKMAYITSLEKKVVDLEIRLKDMEMAISSICKKIGVTYFD